MCKEEGLSWGPFFFRALPVNEVTQPLPYRILLTMRHCEN